MTLARAESVELCRQARLQGIKKVAGGEEAEEVCGEHSERFGSKWKDRDDTWRPTKDVCSLLNREELEKVMKFPELKKKNQDLIKDSYVSSGYKTQRGIFFFFF